MAFSYGFYNYSSSDTSTDHKIYDAEAISRIFDGIILDGVYAYVGDKFMVWGPTNSAANTVVIGTGRAWFKGTWNYNDSKLNFSAPNPPASNKRIDALIIDINLSTRHNEFKWVQGSVSANPTRPTLTKSGTHYQYAIAYVTRTAGTTVITDNSIANAVGTSETPYVTGILQMVDTEQLLANFDRAFNDAQSSRATTFNTFMTTSTNSFNTAQTQRATDFTTAQNQRTTAFNTAQTQRTTDFNTAQSNRNTTFNNFMSTSESSFSALYNTCSADFSNSLTQWQNTFTSLCNMEKDRFDDLMETTRIQASDLLAGFDTDFGGFMVSKIGEFSDFMTSCENEFNSFMDSIQTQCQELIETYNLIAEGYAIGKQNGTDVGSSSPYYHNNSKWYKEQAEEAATRAEDAKSNVYGAIGIPEFTVDFTTGKLMYTNQSQYTFTIDTTTGQLTYAP